MPPLAEGAPPSSIQVEQGVIVADMFGAFGVSIGAAALSGLAALASRGGDWVGDIAIGAASTIVGEITDFVQDGLEKAVGKILGEVKERIFESLKAEVKQLASSLVPGGSADGTVAPTEQTELLEDVSNMSLSYASWAASQAAWIRTLNTQYTNVNENLYTIYGKWMEQIYLRQTAEKAKLTCESWCAKNLNPLTSSNAGDAGGTVQSEPTVGGAALGTIQTDSVVAATGVASKETVYSTMSTPLGIPFWYKPPTSSKAHRYITVRHKPKKKKKGGRRKGRA